MNALDNYDQILFAPSDIAKQLADRLKRIRKRKKITQRQLASRSNVSYASLCRFEQTGLISLEAFIKLTMELGVADEIKDLFTRPVYTSIEEVMNDRY
jgi:transcriptional regulator with XRE-family HTH domain